MLVNLLSNGSEEHVYIFCILLASFSLLKNNFQPKKKMNSMKGQRESCITMS